MSTECLTIISWGLTKGSFSTDLPWNENWNEGTFGCSPGTKTGTRVRSHVPPENEGTFAKTIL